MRFVIIEVVSKCFNTFVYYYITYIIGVVINLLNILTWVFYFKNCDIIKLCFGRKYKNNKAKFANKYLKSFLVF